MRDIVVTVPKSRLAEVTAEEEDVARREAAGEVGIVYYWQMGRLPKVCPRRLYFVWNGAMRAYHDVISMVPEEGRIYMATRINDIEPISMKGFQGFRYYGEEYNGCKSNGDGECDWKSCPQIKDGEPEASGRHCPRWHNYEEH